MDRADPGPGRKLQISTDGGSWPVWNKNGRELFFLNANQMLAVSLQNGPTLSPGTPQVLITHDSLALGFSFDVTADGQRFIVTYAEPEVPVAQFHVVLNWFEELESYRESRRAN